MKSTNERDSHFFLAGWNGARRDVDATEHFQNASKTAPTSCLHQIHEPTVNQQLTIEREAFEKYMAGSNLRRTQFDDYENNYVHGKWEAWQTRAALAATPAAAPTDEPVFLQRLRVEQQELDARQQKLGAFIESSEFRLLSETDAALLSKQEALQHVLLQTLNQRIHSASEKHMREKRNA